MVMPICLANLHVAVSTMIYFFWFLSLVNFEKRHEFELRFLCDNHLRFYFNFFANVFFYIFSNICAQMHKSFLLSFLRSYIILCYVMKQMDYYEFFGEVQKQFVIYLFFRLTGMNKF